MGLFDNNLTPFERMAWVVTGYVVIILGLFLFISSPYGAVIIVVGALTFGMGYWQWNPVKALVRR